MKMSTRILFLMIFLDVFFIGGAAWLIIQLQNGAWGTSSSDETIRRIMVVAGTAVGGITPILLVFWFALRRKGM